MEFDHSLLYASPDRPHSGAVLRFTLETGRYAAQTFVANLHICPSPTCDCASIGLECRHLANTSPNTGETPADDRVWWLDADIMTRQIGVRHGAPPGSESLVQAVKAEIKDSDWKMLADYFQNIKLVQLEAMDIAKIDAHFPPEVTEEGLMCGYREKFPWSRQWTFPLVKDMWLMLDAYCVQPGCDCTEASLSFFNLGSEPATDQTHPKPTVFLYFDHVTGNTRMDEALPGSPPVARLMSALTAAYPAIRQTLQQRHHQLQQLGQRLIGKRRSSKRRFSSLWGSSAGEAIPPQPVPAVRLPPPASRNDPCPCGSGKKFKKCCGSV